MVYLMRCMVANFLDKFREDSINTLPIYMVSAGEEDVRIQDHDKYIDIVIKQMGRDAQGGLFVIVPLVMRVNIFIYDIQTNAVSRTDQGRAITLMDCKAELKDFALQMEDSLNFW